jgi:UDP-glucose 6-dehydrogenase
VNKSLAIVGFTQDFERKISSVGARGVVHTPQFNGKQEGWSIPDPAQPALPPQR